MWKKLYQILSLVFCSIFSIVAADQEVEILAKVEYWLKDLTARCPVRGCTDDNQYGIGNEERLTQHIPQKHPEMHQVLQTMGGANIVRVVRHSAIELLKRDSKALENFDSLARVILNAHEYPEEIMHLFSLVEG